MTTRRCSNLLALSVLASGLPAAPAVAQAPKVWDNYDFVPGSKVIFYTDFSEDKVGNFARGLKYVTGTLDVVERDGVKMLRSLSRAEFAVPLGRKLPERFTLEVDLITPSEPMAGYDQIAFEGGLELDRGETSAEINWNDAGMVIIGGGLSGSSEISFSEEVLPQLRGELVHLRLLMDGAYFKFFTNERRNYNIPEVGFKREAMIRVFLKGSTEPNQAAYIKSIRIAESETDVMYDALTAKGQWATQGLLFETGQSVLLPESRPVLKEIASTLQQHADLKILIAGHTDNAGDPASNLALSEARAAAVKSALVSQFSVAASRMTTKGFGDTKPAAPNTTATGRAQNRRVEIIKQ